MLLIRRFEERVIELRLANAIEGPVHPYIGEEAVAVGVCSQLRRTDQITSYHRGHGHCLAKGASPERMFAELLGKREGYCEGRGGSMHVADFSVGMLGANGIVGAGLPIAAGAALAAKMAGSDDVVVSFFGDGAAGAGPFHESLNLSSLWQLPVIWVCENNGWAVATSVSESIAAENIFELGVPHGVPSVQVDGNDVVAMAEAAERAVRRARCGEGPTLMEAVTFRMERHAYRPGAPGDSRPEEALKPWRQRDPVQLFRERLVATDVLSESEVADVERMVVELLEAGLQSAMRGADPSPEDALVGVFSRKGTDA
jgi:acetoin:2,6-dichlorophenolindophenol oxidoreductase subunit alpha